MPEEIDLEQVKELVKLVEKHKLAELTVEEEGVTITVKGSESGCLSAGQPAPSNAQGPAPRDMERAIQQAPEEESSADLVKIEAPMVGVFYRGPSPDTPAFVEVGDMIEVGQTIGLIEAMKVFSEIPSEVAGEVVEIPVQNGKLVQQGEPLVVVRMPVL